MSARVTEKAVIAIVETPFQHEVVGYLIDNGHLREREVTVIDLIPSRSTDRRIPVTFPDGNKYYINLNTPKGIIYSIPSLLRLARSEIRCETLVSSFFFGYSTIFISSLIRSEKNIMIDDGVGSLIFRRLNLTHNQIFRARAKRLIARIFLPVGRALSMRSWVSISEYWTTYDIQASANEKIVRLNYWQAYFRETPVLDNVLFIGSPEVDFGRLKGHEYEKILNGLSQKYFMFDYYPHPDERYIYERLIPGMRIVQPEGSVESFLRRRGIPRTILGLNSSALLNLSVCHGIRICSLFVGCDREDEVLAEIFRTCGVEVYPSGMIP